MSSITDSSTNTTYWQENSYWQQYSSYWQKDYSVPIIPYRFFDPKKDEVICKCQICDCEFRAVDIFPINSICMFCFKAIFFENVNKNKIKKLSRNLRVKERIEEGIKNEPK